ncbi:MAG TPA: hypothetical protein GXX36_09265 [Clostridiaceae bacterium]|nr:hypothetical protein [Clostridiaceae bacterium]
MKSKSRFQRSFWIFQKEDQGYGIGQGPSGYIKIEVRDGKGTLFAAVQNVRDGEDLYIYKLYLIEPKEREANIAYVGVVPVKGNKGELKWAFDPDNVAKTGSSIDRFTVAALLVEITGRKTFQLICPMAAYSNKQISWRESFRRTFDKKAAGQNAVIVRDNDLDSREEHGGVSEKCDIDRPEESIADENTSMQREQDSGSEREQGINVETVQCSNEGDLQDSGSETGQSRYYAGEQESGGGDAELSESYADDQDGGSETGQSRYYAGGQESGGGDAELSESYADEQDGGGETGQSRYYAGGQESGGGDAELSKSYTDEQADVSKAGLTGSEGNEQSSAFMGEQTGPNGIRCVLQNNGLPGVPFNGCGIPCATCSLNMRNNAGNISEAGNVSGKPVVDLKKLENSFNQYFEKFDPFQNKRRDYKWWRIGSPVHLNNILYQHNIRTPLLFNHAVMMSHLKYRHMIAGIYKDDAKKISLIVCGIPAVYDTDTRPFGNMCRWAQLESGRSKYGAFGYWLVYIDPETGRFLSIR